MIAPRHVRAVPGPIATPSAWVTWDRNDTTVTGYEILRDGTVVGTVTVSGDAWDDCAFRDTGVAAGGRYRYQVRALSAAGTATSTAANGVVRAATDYGAVVDVDAQAGATDTARAQAAIDAAIAAGGGVVRFGGTTVTPKTYALGTLTLTSPNKVLLVGGGMDATFIQPNFDGDASAVAEPKKLIVFTGALASLTTALSAAIAVGDREVTVVDAAGLAVGDLIVLDQMNPQQDPEAMRVAGVSQDPATPNDRRYPWDANEITAISGTKVTFRHPFSQPFTTAVTWRRYTSGRDVGIESMTIQGRSSTEATFYRLVDFVNCARVRVADVRCRWPNKTYFRFSRVYDFTVVGLRVPHAGPSGFGGTGTKYKLDIQRTAHGFVVDAEMGQTTHQENQSYITAQWSQRFMVRHSRFYGSDNYAMNEHGGGSRHCVFENNFVSKCASGAFFLGNTTWGPSGETIIRNNTLEDNVREVYAQENSYGVRVLDNVSRRVTVEFMYWMGWGQKADATYTPIPDTTLWGSAKMVVRGNQVLAMGATAYGLIFGRSDSTWYPYLGMRDLIVDGNRFEAASTTQRAVWLRGDSVNTVRFQVRNTTGTNLGYVKPAFTNGVHWTNNANNTENYGTATDVSWDDEFFAWEVVSPSVFGTASVSGEGRVVVSGSVTVAPAPTTGSVVRQPSTNTVVVTGWTNPNNAHADDTSYATAAPAKGATISSDWRGFGFDALIPTGAEITSVTVALTWVASDGRGGPMGSQVYVSGVAKGTEFTKDPSTVEATDSYTVPGLTRSDLLDANFAVRVRASRANATGTAYTASLDVIVVTVGYSMPVYRSVAISGVGVVTAVGQRVTAGVTVTVLGAGQVTVTTRKRAIGIALVSAPGVASARGGRPTTLGVAHVLGEGVVTVTNRKGALGQARVEGEGVLSADGRASTAGDAHVEAVGSVVARGSKRSFGVAFVTGEGVVVITAPQPTFPDAPIAPAVVRANLIPTGPESPLSPVSGTEIRFSLGVVHPEGDVELTEVGVFGLESTDSTEAGGGVKLSIQGMDRSIKIQRDRFREPYIIQPGTNYVAAIMALVRRSLPTTVFRAEPTQHTTPLLQWEFGDDPLEAIADMAESIGYEAFFGGDGAFVLRSAAVVVDDPVWEFVEGPETVVDSLGRGLTREGVYNGVVQRGENRTTDVPPVQAEAWDTDPTSPTYYDPAFPERSSFGAVPLFHVSPFLVTVEQARDAAVARVRTLKGLSEQVTITSRQVPGLEGGDVVRATRARLNLAAVYVIERISLPLRAGMMSVRARERRL